jgi:hypothetical protein
MRSDVVHLPRDEVLIHKHFLASFRKNCPRRTYHTRRVQGR